VKLRVFGRKTLSKHISSHGAFRVDWFGCVSPC